MRSPPNIYCRRVRQKMLHFFYCFRYEICFFSQDSDKGENMHINRKISICKQYDEKSLRQPPKREGEGIRETET